MPQPGNGTGWEIEGRSHADVMAAALRRLVLPENGVAEGEPSFQLVFSGEGESSGEALHAAMEDIQEQCVEQRVDPIDIDTSGVMATDAGTRIWGTVTVRPGASGARTNAGTPRIAVREEEDGRWTITITEE